SCMWWLIQLCRFSLFFFSSRRRHTRSKRDWSSDVCSSDLARRKDIYLDVLALPNGEYELVDEKDIHRALKNRKITEADKDEAYSVADHIMTEIDKDFSQFKTLADHCLKTLRDW